MVVVTGQLMLLVGHWPLFATCGHLCAWWSIGQLMYFGWPGVEVVGVA